MASDLVPVEDLPEDLVPQEDLPGGATPSGGAGLAEAAGRSITQGISGGLGDEIRGARSAIAGLPEPVRAGIEAVPVVGPIVAGRREESALGGVGDFVSRYKTARDADRAGNDAARKAHSRVYLAGELAGAALPAIASGGTAIGAGRVTPLALASGQGAVQGAGYSDADSVRGVLGDSALGAALGAGGHGLGSALGKVAGWIASKGRKVVAGATDKAVAAAEQAKAAEQAARVGSYGGLRQTENKAILNLLDRERSGLLTPENQAALDALRSSGRVTEALNESASNDLEFLSSRIPAVAAAKQEMQAGAEALPGEVKKEAERLLSGSMARRQLWDRLKRYGPVWAGSIAGATMGGPVGTMVGALAGAGARPSIRALARMARHPSVAAAAGKVIQTTGEVSADVVRALTPVAASAGVPVATLISDIREAAAEPNADKQE